MNLFKNTSALLLSTAVSVPIAFLTNVIVTRALSVDDRGIYSLASTSIMLAAVLAQLGLPGALIMRMRSARTPADAVAGMGVVGLLTASAIVAVVCLGFAPSLRATFLTGAPAAIVYLIVAAVPIHLMGQLLSAVARALDRFVWVGAFQAGVSFAGLVCVAATVWLGATEAIPVILALLAARTAFTLGLSVAVFRMTGFTLRIPRREIRETARIGIQNYAYALAGRLHERIDIMMIAYFLQDPAQVAVYAIAAGLVGQLAVFPEAIGQAAFPQLAGLGREEAGTFLCRVVRHATLWVLLIAAVLSAAAAILIPAIFGEVYAASVPVFFVLAPGVVMLTIYRLTSRYFIVIDRIPIPVYTQTGSVIVNVLLNAMLIPRYGILGAAAASLVSYSLESLWLMVVFLRIAGKGPLDLLLFQRGDTEVYQRVLRPMLRRFRPAS